MQFERASKNTPRTARFEVDPETKFHEAVVARKALGTRVAENRTNLDKTYGPAILGVKIGSLDITRQNDEGKTEPIPAEINLTNTNAKILCRSLQDFIDDTPKALVSAMSADPSNCNMRVVEGMMAQSMLNQINEEYSLTTSQSSQQIGFTVPK